jgi:O-antigen/teichoic acid export membrane protein
LLIFSDLKNYLTIELFIYAQTIGWLATLLIAFLIIYRKTPQLKLKINLALLKIIIKECYPLLILMLLMSSYTKLDTVIMERMLSNGAHQVGIYASAYRLLDAVNMIAFLVSSLLLPMFSRMIRNKENVQPLLKLSFSILVIPAMIFSIACFFYKNEIMTLLYYNSNDYNNQIFALLMIAFIPIANNYIFGTLLTANGDFKTLNFIAFTCLVVNVGLNIFLIPKYEALGAAIATVCTQFIATGLQTYYVSKKFGTQVKLKTLFLLMLLIIFSVIVSGLFYYSSINWLYSITLSCLCALIAAIMVKLIPLKEMIRTIKTDI